VSLLKRVIMDKYNLDFLDDYKDLKNPYHPYSYCGEEECGVCGKPTMKEQDPNGLKPSDPGAKLDAGKPDLDLVLGDFSRALVQVGNVGTFGANKYSRSGWLSVSNAQERYRSALLRHYFYERCGEQSDPESNLLHAAHLAWNSLAYLELLLRENEDEKRYILFQESIKGDDAQE